MEINFRYRIRSNIKNENINIDFYYQRTLMIFNLIITLFGDQTNSILS